MSAVGAAGSSKKNPFRFSDHRRLNILVGLGIGHFIGQSGVHPEQSEQAPPLSLLLDSLDNIVEAEGIFFLEKV